MEAEKKAFKITKREIGFVLGIVVFLLVKFLPLAELSSTVELTVGAQTCLALTLATVVFWACGVAQPGFVGLLYCALLVLFKVCVDDTGAASISATVASTFSSWTKATMWLVIGAYLIASAVKESGLGERIAYAFMLKFVRDAKSLIISIFALTFVLSLLIPHPFPRAFLILAVVSVIAESAGYGDDDRGKLGFLVFAAAAPGSMFFLTGDSTLNPLVAQYSAEAGGMSPSFIDWFLYMSVPMLVALLCTLFLGLFLFKPSKELVYDRERIVAKQAALGKLSVKEIRTIVWLVIAIALWLTVSGDYIGWVTLAIGVALAMPIIGEVLTPASWNAVDIKSLMFLTAAMAVGSVGGATGMNAWIADVVLPSSVPENIFLFPACRRALHDHQHVHGLGHGRARRVRAGVHQLRGRLQREPARRGAHRLHVHQHPLHPAVPQPADPYRRGQGRRRLHLQRGYAHGHSPHCGRLYRRAGRGRLVPPLWPDVSGRALGL